MAEAKAAVSTPAMPGTPGKCMPVGTAASWGRPHTCFTDFPTPDVSITRKVGELAGIAVGATVMLNSLVAGPSSGASMNPVRTLGPAIAAGNYRALWIYFLAPMLGAIAGAGTYTLVKLREDEADPPPRQVRSFRR